MECHCGSVLDCLAFWHLRQRELDKLYYTALHALSTPASSAPIERVFSKGGLITEPLRSKLLDSRVSTLIFLKRNGVGQV